MAWEDPVIGGFAGLNSFFGQVTPYLLPIVLVLFLAGTLLLIGRRAMAAVS
jgi:hypothetical protein